jgi:hypothetical protein
LPQAALLTVFSFEPNYALHVNLLGFFTHTHKLNNPEHFEPLFR